MTDILQTKSRTRGGFLMLPLVMLGGTLAAGLVIVSELDGPKAVALDRNAISDVVFVARAESADLEIALRDTCAATGCRAEVLHPMILATAAQMTADELEQAIEAQTRIRAESEATRKRALQGTELAQLTALEIMATDRIMALYQAELARR